MCIKLENNDIQSGKYYSQGITESGSLQGRKRYDLQFLTFEFTKFVEK